MKNITFFTLVLAIVLGSCKNESAKNNQETGTENQINYLSFGEKIESDLAVSKEEMAQLYAQLKQGDTIQAKFLSTINEVCKEKGCWMNLDLGNNQESFVQFKDYGFFMPLNADGREVIVNGKAYIKVKTVEELRHFAEDAGKSEEEIAKITEPKVTLAFEADGVLMKE